MYAFSSYMYQTQPILTLTIHWIILIKTEEIKVQNYTTEYTEKACLVFTKHFKTCTTMNVDEVSNATHGKCIFLTPLKYEFVTVWDSYISMYYTET